MGESKYSRVCNECGDAAEWCMTQRETNVYALCLDEDGQVDDVDLVEARDADNTRFVCMSCGHEYSFEFFDLEVVKEDE